MKLTVLADNNVLQSKNFIGEHGFCLYIEADDKKILFDTGYSDVFLKNALKMGINLLDLDYIVLSHGHYDHTWGLTHYLPFYTSALKQGQKVKKTTILTHPDTFNEKFKDELGEIGSILSIEELKKNFDIKLSAEPFWISSNLIFLGEIPRINKFEAKEPIGKVSKNNKFVDDYIIEDSALAFILESAILVITGCSHSGICNILDYASLICGKNKITNIIGGFHILKTSNEKLSKTIEHIKKYNPNALYPCHCTDFSAKAEMNKHLNLKQAGVGLKLEYL